MFAPRYFAPRAFAPRYFPPDGDAIIDDDLPYTGSVPLGAGRIFRTFPTIKKEIEKRAKPEIEIDREILEEAVEAVIAKLDSDDKATQLYAVLDRIKTEEVFREQLREFHRVGQIEADRLKRLEADRLERLNQLELLRIERVRQLKLMIERIRELKLRDHQLKLMAESEAMILILLALEVC